jgi:preprotein translocase subunit SecG
MYTFLIVIFVLICILMTFVILIQSSKGGGLAGTFGGMDAMGGSMFGGRGAGDFLTRLTTGLAAAFMVLALLLGLMTRGELSQESLIERERQNRLEAPSRILPQAPDPAQQNPGTIPQPEQNQ